MTNQLTDSKRKSEDQSSQSTRVVTTSVLVFAVVVRVHNRSYLGVFVTETRTNDVFDQVAILLGADVNSARARSQRHVSGTSCNKLLLEVCINYVNT